MKKTFCTLLIIAMAASLCACGKTSSTTDKEVALQTPEWEEVFTTNSQSRTYMNGFDNESYGVSVGYAGQIKYTTDGAATWNDGENTSYCRFGLMLLPNGVGYTCGNAGHVTKTTDGGKTWNRMADFGDFEPNQCRILSFINADTGFIAAQKRLAVTTDGATTWTELTSPEDISGLRFVSEKECYIIGTSGTIYLSTDLGATWNKADFSLPEDMGIKGFLNSTTINVSDDGIEFFCIDKDGKFRIICSTDKGATWNEEVYPEINKRTYLYLSSDGKYITVNDTTGGKFTVLKKLS